MRVWRQKNKERLLSYGRALYRRQIESGTYWRDRNKGVVLERRREAYKRSEYDKHLRDKYGISEQDYERLLVEQGGRCAICRTDNPPSWKGRKRATWHIDHDHATGVVRGLLCFNCNSGLGHFKDSDARLIAAADYLRRTTRRRESA